MKTTKIVWISSFFEKKSPKNLSVQKKALPLHPQSREVAEEKRNFRASREQKNVFLCRGAAGNADSRREAEIAQLVEHNLAKVGVAGPSPVFRSFVEQKEH